MTEVLLTALTNSDIDWMTRVGRRQQIAANSILIQQGKLVDALYVILEGTLAETVSGDKSNVMGRAFAALEGDTVLEQEIGRYFTGDVIGEVLSLDAQTSSTNIKAVEPSLVLIVPQKQLQEKLQQDGGFAARFYQATAVLILERFQRLLEQFMRRKQGQIQPLKDVYAVFGELSDGDVDWMIEHGTVEEIPANMLLIQEGRPIESFYILLGATLSLFVSETQQNALSRAFSNLEGTSDQPNTASRREIARLSTGEIAGETPFLEMRSPRYTIQALTDSLVLSIPRQQILIKLQQDEGFAARFYRVIALLQSERLKGLISRLGYVQRPYAGGQPLQANVQYEDELDFNALDHMELAGARFNLMLRRLKVGSI